jgi:hypothetical protein
MNAPNVHATEPFDWSNDPAVILQRREPVAAYLNADGQVCIIQQRWPDDDAVICIPREDAEYFASRIAALAQGKSADGGQQS